jgi:hypothetical protein
MPGVGGARAQDGGDELAGLPVEDEQRVVHVLPVIPMIGAPLLLPMRRVVGAVQVEDDVRRHAVALALAQIDLPQRLGQPVAIPRREAVLPARQRRLAG